MVNKKQELIEAIDKLQESQVVKFNNRVIDLNMSLHRHELRLILKEDYQEWNDETIDALFESLLNEEKPSREAILKSKITNPKSGRKIQVSTGLSYGKGHPAYPPAKGAFTKAGYSEEEAEKVAKAAQDAKEKNNKKSDEETTSSGMSSENIDAIDGETKKGGLNGTEKAPGTATSTVNEIGVGYAMACMEEEPDNVSGCLDKKLDDTKLGKKASEEQRQEIIQSARAEKKRVDDHMKEKGMNPESTKVSHVWGSKKSLKGQVDHLEKQGVKEVNGIPCNYDEKELYQFDKNGNIKMDKDGNPIPKPVEMDENGVPKNYAQVLLNGGGGDDPTDTTIVMVDDSVDPPKCEILHTSNKTTSDDIQGNGSPNEELNQITESAKNEVDDPKNKEDVEKATKESQEEIANARVEQKEYVNKQSTKMNNHLEDDATCDKAIAMLENDEDGNPPGISSAGGKYFKVVTTRKAVKKFMKENNIEPPLTQEQKRQIMRVYADDIANSGEELRDNDVQILARMYGDRKIQKRDENGKPLTKGGKPVYENVNGEEFLTGKPAEDPVFSNKELNSYYEKQTDAINNHREKLNEIGKREGKPGLGDKQHTKRMIHRLHLGIADGESAGGVPADSFQLNMGRYKRKDIQKGKDGKHYTMKDGKWYEITKDGVSDEPSDVSKDDLSTSDCAVIADGKTHRHCLGMKEGEKVEDGFSVEYGEIEKDGKSYKAIIYDRNRNIVGYQICRSKSGPGGSVNDTIQYHKDYQKCMAEHTIASGRCG